MITWHDSSGVEIKDGDHIRVAVPENNREKPSSLLATLRVTILNSSGDDISTASHMILFNHYRRMHHLCMLRLDIVEMNFRMNMKMYLGFSCHVVHDTCPEISRLFHPMSTSAVVAEEALFLEGKVPQGVQLEVLENGIDDLEAALDHMRVTGEEFIND